MTEIIPTHAKPTAEAILSRSEAEGHEVHSYALNEINRLKLMIASLELNIESKRQARERATRDYVEAVDQAVRASRVMEEAVSRLAEAIDRT